MLLMEDKATTTSPVTEKSLSAHVKESLDRYFSNLGTQEPIDVYNIVMGEVEPALFEKVMRYARGNQSRAARILGISRGTLRKKLAQYFEDTHIGKNRG